MGIKGSWEAYQFDAAVRALGVKVDNALADNANAAKKKRKPPEWVIMTTLGLEPKDVGFRWSSLSDKVTGVVKAKPGEDWFHAVKRWENDKERAKSTRATGPIQKQ